MDIRFPYRIDASGRTAGAQTEEHVRQLIEQVLFTSPGERINRPDFGCGLAALVFAPNSPELAAATQFMVQGALQRWLGDLVQVEAVRVAAEDSILRVEVQYRLARTQERRTEGFSRRI